MITVSILINGQPIFTRTAVNRKKETGAFILDSGEHILHDEDEGAVKLAIKMLKTIKEIK